MAEAVDSILDYQEGISEVEWLHSCPPVQIHLNDEITPELAAEFESAFREVQQSKQKEVLVVINSAGGCLYSAFKIVDILKNSNTKIVTLVRGAAMSAAALIFSCGDERIVNPNASIMIHTVRSYSGEVSIQELENEIDHTRRLQDMMCRTMAENCNKRVTFFKKKMEKKNTDTYMTPDETLKCGLATIIGDAELVTRVTYTTEVAINRQEKRRKKRKLMIT